MHDRLEYKIQSQDKKKQINTVNLYFCQILNDRDKVFIDIHFILPIVKYWHTYLGGFDWKNCRPINSLKLMHKCWPVLLVTVFCAHKISCMPAFLPCIKKTKRQFVNLQRVLVQILHYIALTELLFLLKVCGHLSITFMCTLLTSQS